MIAIKAKIFRDSANLYWLQSEDAYGAWLGSERLARAFGIELEPWESQEIEIRVIKRGAK